MTLLEILTISLYGGALFFVIYFILGLMHKPSAQTIIVYDQPPVYRESPIWPWYGGYNWYNTWSPWSYTGGGYYGHRYHGPRWGSGGRPYGGAGRSAHGGAPRVSGAKGTFGGGGRR